MEEGDGKEAAEGEGLGVRFGDEGVLGDEVVVGELDGFGESGGSGGEEEHGVGGLACGGMGEAWPGGSAWMNVGFWEREIESWARRRVSQRLHSTVVPG